jgi:uncharacterized protein
MKQLLITILFIIQVVFVVGQKLPPRPNPPRLVNDFTNTLSADQVQALERKLVAFDDSTSNQIAIVIIPTTGDYEPADYATTLGREWGIGNKKTNNGVLILVAKNDRKVFIAPGYGLEGAIPDATAKSIIDYDILPNFRGNDYYRGLEIGTNSIIKAASGEYKAPAGYRKRGTHGKKDGGGGGLFLGILAIVLFLLFIGRRGGGGGRGGGMVSRRGYGDFVTGAILGNILSGGGRSSGGFGGGGFGGGDSGGGFGGFGGGSFGGGGSGGSW